MFLSEPSWIQQTGLYGASVTVNSSKMVQVPYFERSLDYQATNMSLFSNTNRILMQEKLTFLSLEWLIHIISEPEHNIKGDEGLTIWGEHEGEITFLVAAQGLCHCSTVCPLKLSSNSAKHFH